MGRIASVALAIGLLSPGSASSQDLPESSPRALMHHAQGIEAYVQARNEEAIRHFRLAYEEDPTSYVSLLMAGIAAGNAGQGARSDSFCALVVPHKDRLSAYYRARLEAQMAGRAGDLAGAIAGNRRAAAVGPGTKALYNVAQNALAQGRAHEAREALRQLDPDREPMKGWWAYQTVYSDAAHSIGDYEDELQMARKGRAAFSDLRAANREALALAALARAKEAETVLGEIRTMAPVGTVTAGEVITAVAQEFGAHGNPDAAKRWLEGAVAWFDALPATEAQTVDNRGDKAYALYSLGRFKDAAAIYDALAAEPAAQPAWKAWRGYMAALLGDKAQATEVSKRIEANQIQFSAANRAIWRGLIAAGLNDAAGAVALLKESGVHARWMHRDPVLMRVLGRDPAWMAYLKPVN